MAAHRPVEWVQAVVSRFDEQLPIKTGQQNTHTKVSTEHNKECLINISKYKFSLVISGLTTILKNVNNMRIFGEAAEKKFVSLSVDHIGYTGKMSCWATKGHNEIR